MSGASCTIVGVPATPLDARLRTAAVLGAVTLAVVAGCAADPGERLPDGGPYEMGLDAGTEGVAPDDGPASTGTDTDVDARMPVEDVGPGPGEPPLVVRTCAGGGAGCCPSALDFEDGTTEHFLPATCCRMALSGPQVVSMPAACGHGALRLEATFQATSAASMCGQPGASPACAYTAGEVTRPVLAPLNLTGRTVSVMVYLQGAALPAGPVHGSVFLMGPGGLVEGPQRALTATDAWMSVDLGVPADGSATTDGVRVLGVRIDFHGQPWTGRVFLDEVTWK